MTDDCNADAVAAGWNQHVSAWKRSGQSQMDFCRANKLSYSRFVYWRRKVDRSEAPLKTRQRAGGFAAVVCEAPADSGLTLSLPNGLLVRGICAQNVAVVRALLDQFR